VNFLRRLLVLLGLIKEQPQPAAPTQPTQPTPSNVTTIGPAAHDYARWGDYTPYQLQMMAGRSDGPFPRGVPPSWDWSEWARVNGKPDPNYRPPGEAPRDRSGRDLGEGGGDPKVNAVTAGIPISFTFVRNRARYAHLYVSGAPGKFFRNAAAAFDAAGLPATLGPVDATDYMVDASDLAEGPHTFSVVVDGSGSLGVQLNQVG
jgi:catechol 2,3-dioxygenase-like lactoylglutathione lyase family enzyme